MDFQSIKTVKEERLKNLRGIVTKISDLKSGTTEKGDWTLKIFTFEDKSATLDLACFNDEIKKFEKGFTYEVENFYWKQKDDKYSAALGQYAKINKIAVEQQTQITEPETKPYTGPIIKLPEINTSLKEFVLSENMLLLQIEEVIKTQHQEIGIPPNGQHTGMHAREIYLQARKTNLIKASEIKTS